MSKKQIIAGAVTLVLVLSVVIGAMGYRAQTARPKDATASLTATTAKGGALADLLGNNSATTGTTDSEETSTETSEPERSTTAAEETTETTAAPTAKTEKAATSASSGLFQVSQDYKKSHDYAIAVNTSQNIVIIYKKDAAGNYTVPFKAMTCSCGRSGHETPSGQYTTLEKQRWLYLIDGTYGQYCTKFKEHYWFHSVPYYSQSPSDLEWPEYNKLGSNASAGCVRLCVRDVKWLYDNVSLGTVVRVYSSSVREPLAKPATVKIDPSDSNANRGWDPTDPDPANPYH